MRPQAGAAVPADRSPVFLITIDTEGDDAWSRPREITTRNLGFLPRFQELCERFDFKPTYLTNWEASNDPGFREFASDLISGGRAEVGMHLHAWYSPPAFDLTGDDLHHQPYLTDYPGGVLRSKVAFMTDHLEEVFGVKMVSHRGGRWAFDAVYASALADNGYHVDCSLTPHVSWRAHAGDPQGAGGPDHSSSPETSFLIDLGRAAGASSLIEVPMTILRRHRSPPERLVRRALGKQLDRVLWMRPNGRNGGELLEVVECCAREGRDYIQFTLHSSEFMPGGSPDFRTEPQIEQLYTDLEQLFEALSGRFEGSTLGDYAGRLRGTPGETPCRPLLEAAGVRTAPGAPASSRRPGGRDGLAAASTKADAR